MGYGRMERRSGVQVLRGLRWALALLTLVWTSASEAQPGSGKSDLAPDSLETLDGGKVTLQSLAGKPMVLNFWATWCRYCEQEMPAIQSLQDSLGDRVRIVGIDHMPSEAARRLELADIQRYVRERGYTWTFLADRDGSLFERYNIDGVPATFFVDARGKIVRRRIGPLRLRDLQDGVRAAMAGSERPDDVPDTAFGRAVSQLYRGASWQRRARIAFPGGNEALLTFDTDGGRKQYVYIQNPSGKVFAASAIRFQVPSMGLDRLPAAVRSDILTFLLEKNLGYPVGAWAVDTENSRLALVATLQGAQLNADAFGKVCLGMVRIVDAFERDLNSGLAALSGGAVFGFAGETALLEQLEASQEAFGGGASPAPISILDKQ